jgi:hypothetical protein
MNHARAIGRLSILAVGLGIGAAAAATSPTAAAAPTMPVDPVGVLPDLPVPAADIPGLDLSISFDGMSLFQSGNAEAETGMGTFSFAIASGDDSVASAGTGEPGTRLFDSALANGTDSHAESGGGTLNGAFANGEGTIANAEDGNVNIASANGLDSHASAEDGNYNAALASGQDSEAHVGGTSDNLSSFDYSTAIGTNTTAESGGGFEKIPVLGEVPGGDASSGGDIAWVFDPAGTAGSSAFAGNGIADAAGVSGDDSFAAAGFDVGGGNFDLGAALGPDLTSTGATGGSFLLEILPFFHAI